MFKTCRICGNSENNQPILISETMFGTRQKFPYFQCSLCKCLQISEFPEDMSIYYPSEYYSFTLASKNFRNPIERIARRLRDRYAVFNKGLVGKLLYHYLPDEALRSLSRLKLEKSMRILDVGSGAGFLLYSLAELGFNKLLGVDPFLNDNIEYDNGLKILKKSIYEITGDWDLIMFHHSFEHLPDPLETLIYVSNLLNRSGTCLIRMPTVSSYAWEYYGVNWVGLDAPRHLFVHSIESMNLLVEKANLYIFDMYYDSTGFQFWGSEIVSRGIPVIPTLYRTNPLAYLLSRHKIAKFTKKARELNIANRGDQVVIYLKKGKAG